MSRQPIYINKLYKRINSRDDSTDNEKDLYFFILYCLKLSYCTDKDFFECATITKQEFDYLFCVCCNDSSEDILDSKIRRHGITQKRKTNKTPHFYVKCEQIFNFISNNCEDNKLKEKFFKEVEIRDNIDAILKRFTSNI